MNRDQKRSWIGKQRDDHIRSVGGFSRERQMQMPEHPLGTRSRVCASWPRSKLFLGIICAKRSTGLKEEMLVPACMRMKRFQRGKEAK